VLQELAGLANTHPPPACAPVPPALLVHEVLKTIREREGSQASSSPAPQFLKMTKPPGNALLPSDMSFWTGPGQRRPCSGGMQPPLSEAQITDEEAKYKVQIVRRYII
jgi:hypothetical protein